VEDFMFIMSKVNILSEFITQAMTYSIIVYSKGERKVKQWSFTQPLINTSTNTLPTTCGQTLGHNLMQMNIVGFKSLAVHTQKC
jgi:hypothetical protein